MTVSEIQREIAALPLLIPSVEPTRTTPPAITALTVVSKQGRLLLRISAALEALEGRTKELLKQSEAERAERERLVLLAAGWEDRERIARSEAAERFRQCAMEAIHLMDSLEWAASALQAQQHPLASEVALARKEGARRLATVGITELPATGPADGRFHEGADTVATDVVPAYHIVTVVRPGWQCGDIVLRRATVLTATPLLHEEDAETGVRTDLKNDHESDERGNEREQSTGKRRSRGRVRAGAAVPDHRD